MAVDNLLCIGGPRAGEVVAVGVGKNRLMAVVYEDLLPATVEPSNEPVATVGGYVEYKRELLREGDNEYNVFFSPDHEEDGLISHLLNGYKKLHEPK